VLSLIARVLQFSNEEKVVAGLEVQPGSLITTLFQSFANPLMGLAASPQPKVQTQVEVQSVLTPPRRSLTDRSRERTSPRCGSTI
jgi:hypothetical protein